MADDNLALVRQMWAAFDEGGLPAILDFAAPDAMWIPFSAGGSVFEDTESYRRFIEQRQADDEVVEARAFDFEQRGRAVLVSGAMRIRRGASLTENYVYWIHRVENGKIVFTQSVGDEGEARRVFESKA